MCFGIVVSNPLKYLLFHSFVNEKRVSWANYPKLNPHISPQESQSFSRADNNMECKKIYTWGKEGMGGNLGVEKSVGLLECGHQSG